MWGTWGNPLPVVTSNPWQLTRFNSLQLFAIGHDMLVCAQCGKTTLFQVSPQCSNGSPSLVIRVREIDILWEMTKLTD